MYFVGSLWGTPKIKHIWPFISQIMGTIYSEVPSSGSSKFNFLLKYADNNDYLYIYLWP